MKRTIIYFIISVFYLTGQTQNNGLNMTAGSWINRNIGDFYGANNKNGCAFEYFNNERYVPLYLSFVNMNLVKITYRNEQNIGMYKVIRKNNVVIVLFKGHLIYTISMINNLIELKKGEKRLLFKKVSNSYSKDVFADFVRGMIFEKTSVLHIVSFTERRGFENLEIRKAGFPANLCRLFKAEFVTVLQLGSFNSKNGCLPEIGIYRESQSLKGPRTLAIDKINDTLQFVDSTGGPILTLAPR